MSKARLLRATIFILILIFFTEESALAWGPLTHIALSSEILKLATLISSPIIELLLSHRKDFLYGNVYADVILGKNLMEYRNHTHNWKNGLRILENAKTPEQKSFAYGYLCHLASDCIAHNFYIPRFLILSYNKRYMKHTYWELRFDNIFHKSTWRIATSMVSGVNSPVFKLLDSSLVKPLLPLGAHRRLFNGIMFLQRLRRWRDAVEKSSQKNGFSLSLSDSEIFFQSSINFILDIIKNPDNSSVFAFDPTGSRAIAKAKYMRNALKNRNLKELPAFSHLVQKPYAD